MMGIKKPDGWSSDFPDRLVPWVGKRKTRYVIIIIPTINNNMPATFQTLIIS